MDGTKSRPIHPQAAKDQAGEVVVIHAGLELLPLGRVRDYLHEEHCRNPPLQMSIGVVLPC